MKLLSKLFFSIVSLTIAITAQCKEFQFNCTYESSIKITSADAKAPKPKVENKKSEYLFFINDKQSGSNYINLAFKIKSNLKLISANSNLITFVEEVGADADNHFSATIFLARDANQLYPSVRYVHSWSTSLSFYLPSMEIGTCQKIG